MSKWYGSAEVASDAGAGTCTARCARAHLGSEANGRRGPASGFNHSGLLFPSPLPSLPLSLWPSTHLIIDTGVVDGGVEEA